jgi:hypothetical protein
MISLFELAQRVIRDKEEKHFSDYHPLSDGDLLLCFVKRVKYQEFHSKHTGKISGLLELQVVDNSFEVSGIEEHAGSTSDNIFTVQCWGQQITDKLRYCLPPFSIILMKKPRIVKKFVTSLNGVAAVHSKIVEQYYLRGTIVAYKQPSLNRKMAVFDESSILEDFRFVDPSGLCRSPSEQSGLVIKMKILLEWVVKNEEIQRIR